MKKTLIFSACVVLVACVIACKDKEEGGFATLRVRMHDQAIQYDSVNVEVLQVRVHHDGEGWITLDTEAGMYNLLDFQNGLDTLIVPPQQIPSGHISQFRLILGDDNYVVVGGVAHDLALSSQDESGLKLNLHEEIDADEDYTIVVDFDASQSVLLQGNGTYRLKPVLTATVD